MIQSVKIQEELKYAHFREYLGNKIIPLLNDIDANSGNKLHTIKSLYAWNQWSIIKDKNQEIDYFIMHDPIFKSIIYNDLIEKASNDYDSFFGTNNPSNVIEALNKAVNLDYNSFTNEWNRQVSYIAITNPQKDKVLYINLFRDIDFDEINEQEFKSGYLHCLNHFCGKNNQRISSSDKPEKTILPENFIEHVVKCLFEGTPEDIKSINKIQGDKILTFSHIINNEKYKLKFYYSHTFDLYFLSMAHKKS